MKKNIAVFLDRDGVINEDIGYVHKPEDFKIFPGVFESLKKLRESGFKLIIITNQSGIGRGYYTEEDFFKLNNYMLDIFDKNGVKIDKVYFCPHLPKDNCDCRKPKTKFIEDAVEEFDLDIKRCWAVGDKLSDVEIGERAGCRTVLLDSRYTRGLDRHKLKNLEEATRYILKESL